MATIATLSPLPRQMDPPAARTHDRECYYANHFGVLSERRWEWAAANGIDGWTAFPTRRGAEVLGVIDLDEHQMRRRRADLWKSAAEDVRQRVR